MAATAFVVLAVVWVALVLTVNPAVMGPVAVMLIGVGCLAVATRPKPAAWLPAGLSEALLGRLPSTAFRAVVAAIGLGLLGFGVWSLLR